jgi:hypothetical protein
MLELMKARLGEVTKAVAPLIVVVIALQFLLVQAPADQFLRFLAGALLATVGMLLLFLGIDVGILPMGRFIGAELPRRRSLTLILAVTFALAFATTAAEPDVLVLAEQVRELSSGATGGMTLVYVIAAGVGVFTALGMLRVVRGFSMARLLTCIYVAMIALSFLAPEVSVPLAYDAGSVTTGVLTAPVVIALTLGMSSVLGERSAVSDGFGLLGLASAGPIIVLLTMAIAGR